MTIMPLSPPIAFIIMLLAAGGLLFLLSRLSAVRTGKGTGSTKPYACGEDMPDHMIQPDYSQFFPFAFFFTILHVVALTVTTVPVEKFTTVETVTTFVIATVYLLGAVVGLTILYRR